MGGKGTYRRKYYLHRKVKTSGFELQLGYKTKTIAVPPDLAGLAQGNRYVTELQERYSYGVQYLNPITRLQKPITED